MITSGFPRISETFALNELLALDRAGAIEAIFATKAGDGRPPHPGIESLVERVQRIPAGDPEAQARWVAGRLASAPIDGVHAYFAHAPGEIAERAAAAVGVPYSFSAHARDVRKVPREVLRRRARRAACVIACNDDVAGSLRAVGAEVELVPHGVDLGRFAPRPEPREQPVRVLAVGRLVEKKGFAVLLRALGEAAVPLALEIVGDGPLRASLTRQVALAGLTNRVRFAGAVTHHAVPAAVRHGESGLLVPAGDAGALRDAIERLAGDRALRARMGAAGRRVVEREFELAASCTHRLLECLEAAYA